MKAYKVKLATPEDCTGCSSCMNACAKKCISMDINKYGFLQPSIDSTSCIGCRKCEKSCPIINMGKYNDNSSVIPDVYSAILKNESDRYSSASGGAFYAIARYVIQSGGVVFGVKFDGVHVRHDYTECIEGLESFRGSKYVQSEVGQSFNLVRNFLNQNRLVLFSGTPCQVAGLNHFLSKPYDSLITVQLICRGTASPGVWEKHIRQQMTKSDIKDISNIRFRTKSPKYSSPVYSYVLRYDYRRNDNTEGEYWQHCRQDPYFSYFMNHNFRSSCLVCKFRNTYSTGADFTIGDAIGASSIDSYGEKNISTIVAHNPKANDILKDIEKELIITSQPLADLQTVYQDAISIQAWDKRWRMWKVSNLLAMHVPLENISFIYKHCRPELFFYKAVRFLFSKILKK